MPHVMGYFKVTECAMRYSSFIGRFYNLCCSYGFEAGKIMPSRAFCSDESQGYPVILIAKHFGAFPFNHGRVGGIVATARHPAHAHHGKDLVIIQASHVGYDSKKRQFGVYRRLQNENHTFSSACGKICMVLNWYQQQYAFGKNNLCFSRINGKEAVIIDNQLLDDQRPEGLFIRLDRLVAMKPTGKPEPLKIFSTAKAYPAHADLIRQVSADVWQDDERVPFGDQLTAKMFFFKRNAPSTPDGHNHLEHNLSHHMPQIITSTFPPLVAAQVNTQVEFDRTYRTIITEEEYQGRNLAFISGINIDISPLEGQLFPLTKFVPWAMYVQTQNGRHLILEQDELTEALASHSKENPDKINLEDAISAMKGVPELKIELEKPD